MGSPRVGKDEGHYRRDQGYWAAYQKHHPWGSGGSTAPALSRDPRPAHADGLLLPRIHSFTNAHGGFSQEGGWGWASENLPRRLARGAGVEKEQGIPGVLVQKPADPRGLLEHECREGGQTRGDPGAGSPAMHLLLLQAPLKNPHGPPQGPPAPQDSSRPAHSPRGRVPTWAFPPHLPPQDSQPCPAPSTSPRTRQEQVAHTVLGTARASSPPVRVLLYHFPEMEPG